eukprot:NODE_2164_length_753_cov_103.988636_g1743_i0.p1 GENE.NODE_2164_length_753_cov_103.988636_g1743_i0~~NODE_2164_length_753_cov_103.988636_g1743_i0.p1  ORF type:complete len:212 (-),score=58.59 NODE_2164_length_753_cov_103.988636_g1743_i0:118-696(-)
MSSWAVGLFGDQILTKDGLKPTTEVLASKKAVGIYFSAHWCPPCRRFTPHLAEKYKEYEGSDVEIVLASSDKDSASFDSYYGEMPWTALPYDKRDIVDTLSETYSVEGIPTLVIVNGETGELVTTDGTSGVDGGLKASLQAWGLTDMSDYEHKAQLDMLKGMGFEVAACIQVLDSCGGDAETAAAILLAQNE